MKQSFIIAALAASAFAGMDVDDVREAFEDLYECPECVAEEGSREAERELEREIEDFMQDLECWWADRNNGDGDCHKRRKRDEQDQCWQKPETDNGERWQWDWDAEECITESMQRQREQERCLEDGDEWKLIPKWGNEECVRKDDPYMQCMANGSGDPEYSWETETCYESWDAMRAGEQEHCNATGGLWTNIDFFDEWQECYRAGQEEWRDCKYQSHETKVPMEFDWDSKTCMTAKESCESQEGNIWKEDEWHSWCEWDNSDGEMKKQLLKRLGEQRFNKLMKNLSQKPKAQRVLASYVAEFNLKELEDIGRRVEEGERAGEEIIEDMMEEWGPKLEQWEREQRQREEKAFGELCDAILDGVKVDGKKLRNLVEGDRQVMIKDLRRSRNVRSFIRKVAQDDTSTVADAEPKNVKITWEGPSQEEFQEWLEGIQGEAEDIGKKLEDILSDYERKYEDLNRDFEDDLEPVAEDAEDLVNEIGDAVKKMTDSANTEFYALAMKRSQAAAAASEKNESQGGFYYGIASGALSVFAVAGIYAACQSKRKVQDHEQTLL